jgi:ribose 5-phosphate isomerase B
MKITDPGGWKMFHRIGLKVGAKIAERRFEWVPIFCGTRMVNKYPHVHCTIVENKGRCNAFFMGAFYVAPKFGKQP